MGTNLIIGYTIGDSGSESSIAIPFPTGLTLTVASDTQINLSWTNNASSDSFVVERSLNGINGWSQIATPVTNSYNNTGLEPYTDYYYRVRSVVGGVMSAWSDVKTAKTPYWIRFESTGTGVGVSTLRLWVSETMTVKMISGTARFYSNSGGTNDESDEWTITSGALRTIYLKAPSGTSVLNVPEPDKVKNIGSSGSDGWVSGTNAARMDITPAKLALTAIRIAGNSVINGALPTGLTILRLNGSNINWTYSGALPTGLTFLRLNGSKINWTYSGALPTGLTYLYLYVGNINWTYSGALPTGLIYLYFFGNNVNWTYSGALPTGLTELYFAGNNINWTYSGALPTGLIFLYLSGNNINWTGLNVSGSSNITTFDLLNYRISKMSSDDMETLLTNLTNRVGGLPTTITINDYADYASPPQSVVDAVAALKLAKSITTVNLGA